MDLTSTLIGLGILMLFIGPVIFLIVNQNRKINSKKRKLMKYAEENNLHLSVIDIEPGVLLGLDKTKKKLIFAEPKNDYQFFLINLHEISTVKIQTIDFPEREGKMNFISLIFSGKTKKEKTGEIIFYDENDDAAPDAEVQYQSAKKWRNIIQNQL